MTELAVVPLDQDSVRAALDELFTLAGKYNSSDAYLELMRFVGLFRFYSAFNAMLIHTQIPGAQFVCTARRWRKVYRREIKISARPIVILQPMGPVLFVFDVSDTAPLPNARPLPPQVEDPFQVRNGKIGGQLALTIDNAKRDGVRVSERADGSQSAGSIQRAAAGQHLEFSIAKKPLPKSTQIPLWFSAHQLKQPVLVLLQRRSAPADHKLSRRCPRRHATLNHSDHSNSQIVRIPHRSLLSLEKATESYSRLLGNPLIHRKWKPL
jgi:hypothetical protein